METSHPLLLDRDIARVQVKDAHSETLELLRECVDYGTNLIPRSWNADRERTLKDVIVLGVLLKHCVAMLDGVHICLSEGSVITASVQSRALFEAAMSLQWILKEDSERRARAYNVSELRRKLKVLHGYAEGPSQELADLLKLVPDALSRLEESKGVLSDQVAQIKGMLESPENQELNELFDAKTRGSLDPEWFKVVGAHNRRDMANQLGLKAHYDVFYGPLSDLAHGRAVSEHVKVSGPDKITFEPIRNLRESRVVFLWNLSLSYQTYKGVLTHYRPQELENFSRKYKAQWRDRFLSVKLIQYQSGGHLDI